MEITNVGANGSKIGALSKEEEGNVYGQKIDY